MKVLMINVVCGIRSTGRICTDLADRMTAEGHEVKIAYGREDVPEKYVHYAVHIGDKWDQRWHGMKTRVLDEHGFGSKQATKKFLAWAEKYNPDMLWLHNIHGYYINVEMLFAWIKSRPLMKVKWTLHDCWAFTGHCSHFTMVNCEQWKTQCKTCVQSNEYPASKFKDNCKNNFERKKRAFTGVKNMTLITPSKWLAELVKQSFLREYPVEVCYNKVDTTVFKPTPSDFREKYDLQSKKMILGVASAWSEKKGLNDFVELFKTLDSSYVLVLVGLTETQIAQMPKIITDLKIRSKVGENSDVRGNAVVYEMRHRLCKWESGSDFVQEDIVYTSHGVAIPKKVEYILKQIADRNMSNQAGGAMLVCVPRTNSREELAELYSTADYFVNPTYEDTFPTVNLEAVACGAYVITYNTGGCLETIQ